MKTKLTILAMLLCLVVSCQHKPKNRIEERFERYVQEKFVSPKDYKGLNAIEHTDSFDFYSIGTSVLSMADSLNNILTTKIDSLYKVKENNHYSSYLEKYIKDLEFKALWMKYSNAIINDSVRGDSINGILNTAEPSMFTIHSYTLKAKIDGNAEISPYYALDCVLGDTIIYSPSPIMVAALPEPLASLSGLIDRCIEDNKKRIKLIMDIDKFEQRVVQ